MSEFALLVVLDASIVLGLILLRDPKLLIPLVVLGLPIEYFGTQTLDDLGEGGLSGAVRALLNPGKLAMLLTIAVGAFRFRNDPAKLIPNTSLALPIVGLTVVTFLGLGWSDSLKPTNALLIMPMYAAFLLVAPAFIEDRRDVERIIGAFLIAAIALSALAIAQRLIGVFNWRTVLIQSDATTYRSNATFGDPNHLARYLSITVAMAAGLVLATGPRRQTLYLAIPAIGLGLMAIVATASRSGWILVVLCGFLVVLWAPIARNTKVRLIGTAAALVGGVVLISLAQGGANAERLKTLTDASAVLGLREFLIKAGWAMFKDSPLVGVGTGNFPHALEISYIRILPEWARTTLSHTSLISTMAEQGIVGLAMFTFVSLRVGITIVRAYMRTKVPYDRLLVAWLGSSLFGIVLHSQSEGRLLDEPYLWLLLALVVAVETGRTAVRGAAPLPVEAAERAGEAAPVAPARQVAAATLDAAPGIPAGSS